MQRFPGPKVVAGCFLVLMTASGLGFYGLAVYLNVFSREKGWDVSSISLATTVFFVVAGLVGVGVARFIARHDVRITIVGGGVVGGIALVGLGHVDEPWQLFVVYGLFGVGFAGAGLIPTTTVVTRWYHRRRSMALAVASTGLSVGGIVITPFAKSLLDRVSLATGTAILAAVWVVGIVPLALVLVRSDPAKAGWLPDGERVVAGAAAPPAMGVPFADAVVTRFFYGVTTGYILTLGAQVGAIQQLVKLVEERTDADTAAFATVFLAATSVVARLVGGRVLVSLPMTGFTAGLAVVQAVSLVVLAFGDSAVVLFAGIMLFGATVGNILMLQPLLIAERFGVVDYARIFSRSQLLTLVGTAGGPLLLGWLHDIADGYELAYVAGAFCSLTGGVALALSGSASHAPVAIPPACNVGPQSLPSVRR